MLNTFATTESASIKKRVSRYMVSTECPLCHGKRLRREALSVKFAGFDIADISRIPLARLADLLRPYAEATARRIANRLSIPLRHKRVVQKVHKLGPISLRFNRTKTGAPTYGRSRCRDRMRATRCLRGCESRVWVRAIKTQGADRRHTCLSRARWMVIGCRL